MLKTDSAKRIFIKDGTPYFFLLDTAWMAFSNLTQEAFEDYVRFRRAQGYNGLLIQHTPAFQDMPASIRYVPYEIRPDGSYRLTGRNPVFFEETRKKLEILQKYGMTLFIVPVWVSYIPGSQMEGCFDCSGKQFETFEDYQTFVADVITFYKDAHPVWLLGGDADLSPGNDAINQYYLYMAEQIRMQCPDDLIGAHVSGGCVIDEMYAARGLIDFYSYQSGHMMDDKSHYMSPAILAQRLCSLQPALPVMNLEPMYEAHGFGNRFHRFGAADVRRAFWYSVLSGARAGFAYGAHGVWMCYDGGGFNNEFWSKQPLSFPQAVALPGARDTARAAALYMRESLQNLAPREDLNLTVYEEIRVAAADDLSVIAAYSPCAADLYLAADLSQYDCRWILPDGAQVCAECAVTDGAEIAQYVRQLCAGQKFPQPLHPALSAAKAVAWVKMCQRNSDALLICRRRG